MKIIATIIVFGTLMVSCSKSRDNKKENKEEENELTVCDCAKMNEADAPDECFKLKETWEKKFETADVTRKEEMTKEMIECMNKK